MGEDSQTSLEWRIKAKVSSPETKPRFPRLASPWWVAAVLSFAIPAAFRAIPEILAGPYPLGFDTVRWYGPIIIEAQRNGLASALEILMLSQRAPSLEFTLIGLGSILPLHPFILLKIIVPLLLGFFSLTVYGFARTAFRVGAPAALFIALFVSLYFATLRLSWDLFRNLLAYALFLLTIREVIAKKGSTDGTAFIGLTILTFLTHELVAVLLVVVLAAVVAWRWVGQRKIEGVNVALIVLGVFLVAYYAHWLLASPEGEYLGFSTQPPLGLGINYLQPSGSIGYDGLQGLYLSVILTGFLVLLPLSVFARRQKLDSWFRAWPIFLLVAGLSPLVLASFAFITWDRWIIMAAVPIGILAAVKITQCSRKVVYLAGTLLVLTAGLYSFLPAESAFPLFTSPYTVQSVPSSYLQNTGPLQDSPSIIASLQWVQDNAPKGSMLLTHHSFTGWALVYTQGIEIRSYYRAEDLDLSAAPGGLTIYTIWWTEDIGWYPLEELDPRFLLEHRVDRIGVFSLRDSLSPPPDWLAAE